LLFVVTEPKPGTSVPGSFLFGWEINNAAEMGGEDFPDPVGGRMVKQLGARIGAVGKSDNTIQEDYAFPRSATECSARGGNWMIRSEDFPGLPSA
jgi:hypothetical protein